MTGVTSLLFVALIFVELCLLQTPPFTTPLVHPSKLHRFVIAPCVIQTPPFWTLLVQPSKLHSFLLAPCVKHTPPFTTWLVHPSKLQRFTLAPCIMQTPPFLEWLVHPTKLHCFCFAPCVTQTPPLTTILVHPSKLHCFSFTFAPWVTQTPPLTALLFVPSSASRWTFASSKVRWVAFGGNESFQCSSNHVVTASTCAAGSQRKKTRILRWPGRCLSTSSNDCTWCWNTFGNARIRPFNVFTAPSSWLGAPSFSNPYMSLTLVWSYCS